MNFLILGDGPEERAWAETLRAHPAHRLLATYPSLGVLEEAADLLDVDGALAVPGIEAVIVGGEFGFRAEVLRRSAAEGLAIVVIHPPGPDSEAYYQVALSRDETGAVVVPDLPARRHPGVQRLVEALGSGVLGAFRELRHESVVAFPAGEPERDLARAVFTRAVDVVRALLGEVEAVNATGDPPGLNPELHLIVQLRVAGGRRAEVRLSTTSTSPGPVSISLIGASGSVTLELPPDLRGPSRLIHRGEESGEMTETLSAWDPHEAILDVLAEARARRASRPNLLDATRATEVGEGVVRSLRRGRTVDLHYEVISEEATFKGLMTSIGCMVLLSILLVIPIALAGPALGIGWLIRVAYIIPPLLLGFLFLQLLRFAARRPSPEPDDGNPPASQ